MTSCTPNMKASSNHFPIYHTKGHVFDEKTLIQDHESYHLIDLPFLHQPARFEMSFACLSIHHATSSIILLNPSQRRCSCMLSTSCCLPFKQLVQGQKYFPSSSGLLLSKENSKNYSTSSSYARLMRLPFIQLLSI